MESRKALALNLRHQRVEKGLSQEALAFAAGIDRTYVSGIERGARNPTLDILDSLAEVLEVDSSALIMKTNAKNIALRLRSGRKAKTV